VNIIEATKSGFSNIITWKGRASRSEFWWFYLVFIIIQVVLTFLTVNYFIYGIAASIISYILNLVLSLSVLSLSVRRLHDVGLSGWWYWIFLAPLVIDKNVNTSGKSTYLVLFGFMYLYKIFITKGEELTNPYGADPLNT
tara:strand:- start:68 stop:487 length:420 start_codon:yes stop_codon:yes gene_type:complete